MAETPAHLIWRAQVNDSLQLQWPRVTWNVGRVFAVAKIWIAGNIGDDGIDGILIIIEGARLVGAILVKTVASVYALWTYISHLLGTQTQKKVRVKSLGLG